MECPAISCSSLEREDFIRLPSPAAKITTAATGGDRARLATSWLGNGALLAESCATARYGSPSGLSVGTVRVAVRLSGAPRVGVEPTSLVLIQSQAGPADRPTGDRATVLRNGCTVCGQPAADHEQEYAQRTLRVRVRHIDRASPLSPDALVILVQTGLAFARQ